MKALIVKLGASGDVVRTTVVLHLLKDYSHIDWITEAKNKVILPQKIEGMRIFSPEEYVPYHDYDLILSLDEDSKALDIIDKVSGKKLIGAYRENGKVLYTKELEGWFDMSLVSKYGKKKADELKFLNRKTYQEFLFEAFGKEFSGEPYLINEEVQYNPVLKRIGIEARAGERWPTKRWNQFDKLKEYLISEGFEVFEFVQRPTILEYMKDIATCEFLFTGDSLAMHIGLALKIKMITFFTCTSPWEIYDYGVMTKIISPKLEKAFYKTDYFEDVVSAIRFEEVVEKFKKAYFSN